MFDGGLVDSGGEVWQGVLGLRNQILPLKRLSCVWGEEGGGRRYVCVCTFEERRGEECVWGEGVRGMCEGYIDTYKS